VARAYLDQLARDDALGRENIIELAQALDGAEEQLEAGARDRGLARTLERFAATLGEGAGSVTDVRRRSKLAETLDGIAARLR